MPAHRSDAGWVVSAYLGAARTMQTSIALTDQATATHVRFDGVSYEGRSFELPPYYGYRGTYFFGADGWFGVEGEVIHMKVYADTSAILRASGVVRGAPAPSTMPMNDVVQRFSLSHGENMLLVNAVLRHAFGECGDYRKARITALARAGAGPTLPHVESTIDGAGDERYERGALALQLAAGVDLRLWNRLHALAEYKFTRCRQSVSGARASTIDTLLASHHVVFGASIYL